MSIDKAGLSRKGTLAARKLPDDVPANIKQRRLATIIEAQRNCCPDVVQRVECDDEETTDRSNADRTQTSCAR